MEPQLFSQVIGCQSFLEIMSSLNIWTDPVGSSIFVRSIKCTIKMLSQINADIMARLLELLKKSTIQLPPKFVAFATQKKIELTKTEGPNMLSSIKAKDTKEENPALSRITAKIRASLFWKNSQGKAEDAWTNKLPKNPIMFKQKIMEVFENLQVLEIQFPKLQKTADDKLANSPTSAIQNLVSPVLSRNIPNIPPQVQFIPKIVPQLITVTTKGLQSPVNQFLICCRHEPVYLFPSSLYSLISLIYFFNFLIRSIVERALTIPVTAMMKLSLCMYFYFYQSFYPGNQLVIFSMPQNMQKLIPKAGKNNGIEDAQPLLSGSNKPSKPQGAVMMGI